MDIRTKARIAARVILETEYPDRTISVMAVMEHLDDDGRFSHLAFATLEGAVKAAAKKEGRAIRDGRIQAPGNK